uniref:Uncharacterized protein n=2 Tax=Lotharella globosa TaxID=91324 RepID=A0A7S3Y7L9_9EUKA
MMSDEEGIPLAEFATYIEEKDTQEIRELFKADKKFKGYTVMMIAAMHTHGTWVLETFAKEDSKKEKVNEAAEVELKDLARTLQLDVDDDILSDKKFTPLMLAVMFGPPQSVKVLLDNGAKIDLMTNRGFTAKMFAQCRDDAEIKGYFQRNREFCAAYWGNCNLM